MAPQMGAANLPIDGQKGRDSVAFSLFFLKNTPSHGTRPFIWLSLLLFLVGCFSVPLIGPVYFREPSRRCGHEPTNRSRLRETIVSGTAAIGSARSLPPLGRFCTRQSHNGCRKRNTEADAQVRATVVRNEKDAEVQSAPPHQIFNSPPQHISRHQMRMRVSGPLLR